jgi:hypothetical protein
METEDSKWGEMAQFVVVFGEYVGGLDAFCEVLYVKYI